MSKIQTAIDIMLVCGIDGGNVSAEEEQIRENERDARSSWVIAVEGGLCPFDHETAWIDCTGRVWEIPADAVNRARTMKIASKWVAMWARVFPVPQGQGYRFWAATTHLARALDRQSTINER